MDRAEVNAPSMSIELATNRQPDVALANLATPNFGKMSKISVYIYTFRQTFGIITTLMRFYVNNLMYTEEKAKRRPILLQNRGSPELPPKWQL